MADVNHNEEYYLNRIFEYITILLNKHHVACLFSYRSKRKQQVHFGSNKFEEKFRNLFRDDQSWQLTVIEDQDDLNLLHNANHRDVEPRAAHGVAIGQQAIPYLPYPVKYLDFDAVSAWLIQVMFQEFKAKGGEGRRPAFKKPAFKPDWWPEDMWAWETVTHFQKNPQFPGPGTLIEFLKHCVQLVLTSK